MNKQEAIEKIKSKKISNKFLSNYGLGYNEALDEASYIINQIDELKPVVPKFVAEWIENTNKIYNLYGAMGHIKDNSAPSEIMKWFSTNPTLTGEILARAWLDGYEVKKEKLYTVEIPNPNLNAHAILQKTKEGIVLTSVTNARWKGWKSSKLTEAEIKKDFGWAWQFAKEVKEK